MTNPTLKEERKLWRKGFRRIAGIDEAGIGPLAGSVAVAAVILDIHPRDLAARPAGRRLKEASLVLRTGGSLASSSRLDFLSAKRATHRSGPLAAHVSRMFRGVRDSKKLSAARRDHFYHLIIRHPHIRYSVSLVSSKIIDRIGIRRATERAVMRCIRKCKPAPDFIIFDGNRPLSQSRGIQNNMALVKADEKVLSCALASIIAKVTRDRQMLRLHTQFPEYRFDLHKGYGTRLHRNLIKKFGPSDVHRKSYTLTRA